MVLLIVQVSTFLILGGLFLLEGEVRLGLAQGLLADVPWLVFG